MEPSGPSSLLTISRASQDRVSSQLEDLEKQICDILGLTNEQVPVVILNASLPPVLQKYE